MVRPWPLTDNDVMTLTSLRDSLASWRWQAPWREWTERRGLTVGLLVGWPVVVGGLAVLASFGIGMCSLFGSECSPESQRQLEVAGNVFLGSLVCLVASAMVVFVLRRELRWLALPLLPTLMLARMLL